MDLPRSVGALANGSLHIATVIHTFGSRLRKNELAHYFFRATRQIQHYKEGASWKKGHGRH
jgi:hypothetical protein